MVLMCMVVLGQFISSVGGIEQVWFYVDVQLIKDWFGVYVDQQVVLGKVECQEVYVCLFMLGLGWYVKVGQFYLFFGWWLQDSLVFVCQFSGISMMVFDKGVELGCESDEFLVQLVYSNGFGNCGGVIGYQFIGQVVWLQFWGWVGVGMVQVRFLVGDCQVWVLFVGMMMGLLVWLGELDLIGDDGFGDGWCCQFVMLLEVNWLMCQGYNFKFIGEFFDFNCCVGYDGRMCYSLVYEYMFIVFVQLWVGYWCFGSVVFGVLDW